MFLLLTLKPGPFYSTFDISSECVYSSVPSAEHDHTAVMLSTLIQSGMNNVPCLRINVRVRGFIFVFFLCYLTITCDCGEYLRLFFFHVKLNFSLCIRSVTTE